VSKTLLRGLDLIEVVGLHGPMTVTELARRTGVHVTIVSRTVSACEPDGWLMRVGNKIVVGPRCALLGLASPANQAIRQAEPLVAAITGATGLVTTASCLIGRDVMPIATSGGAASLPGVASRMPIHIMAAGRAIAAQLTPQQLDAALPAEPFPAAGLIIESLGGASPIPSYLAEYQRVEEPRELPRTRAALLAEIETIRTGGFARDHGEVHASIHCIAAPWPVPGLPAAFACIGARDAIADARTTIEACLSAATRPGATARDVIQAAALT
jgi:DNA-binding IclR family transcriptional regulator